MRRTSARTWGAASTFRIDVEASSTRGFFDAGRFESPKTSFVLVTGPSSSSDEYPRTRDMVARANRDAGNEPLRNQRTGVDEDQGTICTADAGFFLSDDLLRSFFDTLGAHLARASNETLTTSGDVGGGGRLMTERGVGKPWTSLEDTLLRQAVAVHGENDNWKSVALCVPGRTNKACRKVCHNDIQPDPGVH